MFYRRLNDELYTCVDLVNAYAGCPLFIVAGSPVITSLPLVELSRSGLPTMALNNVLYTYSNPTFWLTADKPECYGGHFFARADIIKFAYMNYRDDVVRATGLPLKSHPMQLLYNVVEPVGASDFFSDEPAFTWWRSVFTLSLQLAWRLGFRRVYLVGCSFTSNPSRPYAWETQLTDSQVKWTQGTYDNDIRRLRLLTPLFQGAGFRIISCTPESRANSVVPFQPLKAAIQTELQLRPRPTPMKDLKHSSEFRRTEA